MVKEVKNGMTFMRERKAISPVIATVILVAVAITVAVGVSYWMSGISSQYTQFEKIEIQTGYATYNTSTTSWTIFLSIKNSGSADATVTHAFLNDVPCLTANYGATSAPVSSWGADFLAIGLALQSGASDTVEVYIDAPPTGYLNLSSGTTINVKLHSAGGMDYIKLIRLP